MRSRSLRRLHYALLAVYFAACAAAWPRLPERIPLHFDFLGRVTAWGRASLAAWLLVPALAAGLSLLVYAASSVPEAWNLSREDRARLRALGPDARERITEPVCRSTALMLILITITLVGLQLGIYATAAGGRERMPWYAQALVLGPIALVLFLAFRDRSLLAARIRAESRPHPERESKPMDFPRLAAYLAELAENNRREWFEANRAEYQALRDQFTAFVGEVIARVAEWDDSVRWVDPQRCLFRIYRDVRFSRDKSPYKTMFAAEIGERGRRDVAPDYYFHVDEKGTLLVAGGIYMPEPHQLARIREHIAEHPEKLQAVLRKRGFKQTFGEIRGERLKRPPRGYSEETPLIEAIKQKSFYLARERDVRSAASGDVLPWMLDTFRAMYPFLLWLREALQGAEEPEPAVYRMGA